MTLSHRYDQIIPSNAKIVREEDTLATFFNQGHPAIVIPGFGDDEAQDVYTSLLSWVEQMHNLPDEALSDPNGGEFDDNRRELLRNGMVKVYYVIENPVAEQFQSHAEEVVVTLVGYVYSLPLEDNEEGDDDTEEVFYPETISCPKLG